MKTPHEAVIRDYFATHLAAIEPGLILRKKEHSIPNADGTGGRVDILARDRADHVVVIEVKRDNLTARETVQELHKYVYLLQRTEGIPPREIRCIVLSVDWEELLAPFTSFVHETEYSTAGFRVVPQGSEFVLEVVKPLPLPRAAELHPVLSAYYFRTQDARRVAVRTITRRAADVPGVSGVAIELNYQGPNEAIILPHAFAIGIWRLPDSQRGVLSVSPGIDFGALDPYQPADWADETDVIWWLLKDVSAMISGDLTVDIADLTRTSLRNHLNAGWLLGDVHRFGGAGPSHAARQDDELLRVLSGDTRFECDTRMDSRIRSSWNERKNTFLKKLAFAPTWHVAAESFFGNLENGSSEGWFVRAYLRDPHYFPYALAAVAQGKEAISAFPLLLIRAEPINHSAGPVRLLKGGITWDGKTCPSSVEQMLTDVFGASELYPWAVIFAWWKPQYLEAYRLHGMEFDCEIAMLEQRPDGSWVEMNGHVQRLREGLLRWAPEEFVRANRDYCDELVRLTNRYTVTF